MPGICGYIDLDRGRPVESALMDSMAGSMGNTDAEKVRSVVHNGFGLGVSSTSAGPDIFDDDGISVAASGEAYNLKGAAFAEEIAALYRQHGEDCAGRIEGQFNFCIVDKKKKKTFIATDRFGTSAINYYADAGRFVFASKIRAVLKAIEHVPCIDRTAVYKYLVFSFVPTPQTIYEGIKKIPPGHILTLDGGRMTMRKYWDIPYEEGPRKGESYYAERIRGTICEAVRRRFGPEDERRHIGAFLSGGLDSSTICGMMRKISGGEVKVFSAGFSEDAYNEAEYIDIAAEHFGLKSYKYIVGPKDTIDAIKVLAGEYDEPFGNSSAVAAYYCMKLAKDNGVRILLGGDGGDENFAGYERYVTNKLYSAYHLFPGPLRRLVIEPLIFKSPLGGIAPFKKIRNYIEHSNMSMPERFVFYGLYSMYRRSEIFTPDFLNSIDPASPLKIVTEQYNSPDTGSELNRLMYYDSKSALIDNDLRGKIDKVSNILGVSVRYPMLDTDLWELGGQIGPGLKLKGLTKKYIFKKALRDFLPREIIQKKKHGFGLPFAVWLRENPEMRRYVEGVLLDPSANRLGYFKKDFFEKMLKLHDKEKSPYYGDLLWPFLMFEAWCRQWKDI